MLAVGHVRHGRVWPLGSCSFGWTSYFFRLLWVASYCSYHFVTCASACVHRRSWEFEAKLLRECRRPFTGWWRWRICRWSVSCLVRSFWLWTLRLISGGAMPDSTYRSGVAVGRMHPVVRRHVSVRVVSTRLRCMERA